VLAIPHYFVLAFLWLGFLFLSVAAFFAILFTGRYPRAIFDFNVGVLRWSWRVAYYAYGALGTDRYPPFTLAEVADYPAHLSVDYPAHLSRGLVLVKWWLLAIPHYLVVALFVGGGVYVGTAATGSDSGPVLWASGLIGVLVLVAAVVLLVTGRYPQPIYDFVLGMNRWVLRVAAYAGLMTDEYPPFRIDLGGPEPGGQLTVPPPSTPPDSPAPSAPTPAGATSWGAGRVTALVLGLLALMMSLGLGAAAGAGLYADQTLRDDDGFLTADEQALSTGTYALVSDDLELHVDVDWFPEGVLGDARVTASAGEGIPVFVGVAATRDVAAYLDGVAHAVVSELPASGVAGAPSYRTEPGDAPVTEPGAADFWVAQSSGTGLQSVEWPVREGTWSVVVMNADGGRTVEADVAAGVTLPALTGTVTLLLALAVAGLVIAAVLLVVALHRPRERVS
jgi:Domain of unknown function (DUF4389)